MPSFASRKWSRVSTCTIVSATVSVTSIPFQVSRALGSVASSEFVAVDWLTRNFSSPRVRPSAWFTRWTPGTFSVAARSCWNDPSKGSKAYTVAPREQALVLDVVLSTWAPTSKMTGLATSASIRLCSWKGSSKDGTLPDFGMGWARRTSTPSR